MARKAGETVAEGRRHERPNPWFRFCIVLIWPLVQLLTRRERHGLANLPRTGGVLVVANHVSIVDPLTVAQLIYDGGRLPHFMAKQSLFTAPVIGRVMRGTQQIPVRRNSTEAAGSLSAALEALERGLVVIIYPEGTTTRDPGQWPMRARTGVARIALTSGVPVIPLAQWGTHRIYGRDRKLHLFRRPVVHARLGEPVDLTKWQGVGQTPAVLREVTDTIMAGVTASLAQIRGEVPPAQPWDPRTTANEETVA